MGRIRVRRVVPSGGLPRSSVPAAIARGAPARPTGGGNAAKSRVSLTRLTGNALAVAPFAEASVPQAGGTDSAPTLAARASPADTAPPTGAEQCRPSQEGRHSTESSAHVGQCRHRRIGGGRRGLRPGRKSGECRQNNGRDRCESADPRVDGVRLQRLIYIGEDLLDDRVDRRRGLRPTGIGDRGALGRQTGRVGVLSAAG